jgi:cupin superfamily acireductone dioxygenase involved in methionine salvage
LPDVDTDKIKAITSIVDEFNNIVAKNFSVYAQYDDFSFANSRSSDKIEEKLNKFFKEHFSGDFQLKNSFENSVLPRIFYLEQRTKFIYSYKILNYMT